MAHKAEIVKESLRRNTASGGIEFRMTCCGELETSVHLHNLALLETHEQRVQVIEQYLEEHSGRHAAELAAEDFLKTYASGKSGVDCGCQ